MKPNLSGQFGAGKSPDVRIRFPLDLRARLAAVATGLKRTQSELIRVWTEEGIRRAERRLARRKR
jgi:predicted DNA-binding protein